LSHFAAESRIGIGANPGTEAGQHLVLDIDAAGPMRAQVTNPDGDFDGPIDHLEGVVKLYVKIQ
jgi:hypothetical protein